MRKIPIVAGDAFTSACGVSEIAARLGKPATSLTRPLAKLRELDLVVREIPFGTDERNGKKSLYRVADPFLAFWFRFVQPNHSRLESAPMAVTLRKVRDAFSQHTAWVFEALARRSVPHLAIAGQEWGIARRWWGTGSDGQPAELDVVAESSDGERLLVGEVKLSTTDAEIVHLEAKLREKALRLPFSKRYQKLETVVFSAADGHKKAPHIVTNADMLRALV